WGRTPIVFLREEPAAGDPRAAVLARDSYRPVELVPCAVDARDRRHYLGQRWFTNAATEADIDGDGHADLIIGNYFNDGAHILDEGGTGREEMQDSMSAALNGGHNRFLLWAR